MAQVSKAKPVENLGCPPPIVGGQCDCSGVDCNNPQAQFSGCLQCATICCTNPTSISGPSSSVSAPQQSGHDTNTGIPQSTSQPNAPSSTPTPTPDPQPSPSPTRPLTPAMSPAPSPQGNEIPSSSDLTPSTSGSDPSQPSDVHSSAGSASGSLSTSPSTMAPPQGTNAALSGPSSIAPSFTGYLPPIPSASSSPSVAAATRRTKAGPIAGGIIGGIIILALFIVGFLYWRRRMVRKRTAPSAEFMHHTRLTPSVSHAAPLRGSYADIEDDQPPPPFTRGSFKDPLFEKVSAAAAQRERYTPSPYKDETPVISSVHTSASVGSPLRNVTPDML